MHRLLSLLGAGLVVGFVPLYAFANPEATDPLWGRLAVAGLLVGLFAASYMSRQVEGAYVTCMWAATYVVMGWFSALAALNRFSADYAVGLLLVYVVLAAVVGFGARSARPVLWFLGFGFLVAAAGMLWSQPVGASPPVLLGSMGTIAIVEGVLAQGWLQVREATREQKSRLRGLANSFPGVVFQFYAREGGSVGHNFVSEHSEETLGIPPDPESFFKQCLKRIPAEPRAEMERSIEEAIERETRWEFEAPFDRPDGERIWVLGASEPERREEEVVFNGVILDITERKRAEQALTEERGRLETLFEALPAPAVQCTAENGEACINRANAAFERTFGIDASDAQGRDVNEILVPPGREEEGRALARRAQEGELVQAEVRRAAAEGTRDFQLQVACRCPEDEGPEEKSPEDGPSEDGPLEGEPPKNGSLKDESLEGGPSEIFAVYTDITERKRRERRLSAIFNQTYQFTGLMQPDGTMIKANETALQFGDLKREDITGKPLWETRWAQTGETSKQKLREAIQRAAEGEFVRYERPVRGKEKTRTMDFSIRPVTDEEGEVTLLIPEARDITELKRREKRLRQAKEEAEKARAGAEKARQEAESASRAKSAMLANMSHEIRTPLTSILGFAEAIGEETAGGTASRFAGLIEKSGHRLLGTLDGVLNLSKLEAGRMELEETTVDLASQAEATAKEFRPEAKEKDLCLQVDTNGAPVWARADEGAMEIILQNLVSNAVKYTNEGTIEIRVWGDENRVVLEVRDTGIGMNPERVGDLFEPFRQASEGFDREYEGTGLGLAVTKKATQQMGGSIEVDTQKGEGSRFTVRLPPGEKP